MAAINPLVKDEVEAFRGPVKNEVEAFRGPVRGETEPFHEPMKEEVEPFRSLRDLRTEHVDLMRSVRREGNAEELIGRVRPFVQRAQATGKLIDSPSDRDAAQGILDYWCAWLFTAADRTALSEAPVFLEDFDPSNAPDLSEAGNPYQGLGYFNESDAVRFVGREEAVKALLDKLRQYPIVPVIGPLGSGKTSLVLAGIVPRLRSRLTIETKEKPLVIVVIPGTDPFGSLLRAIHDAASDPALPELGRWIAEHKQKLAESPRQIRILLETILPDRPIVMVVDQVEELFTLCPDRSVRERFAQVLVEVAKDPKAPDRIILLIREDYAEQVLHLEAFKPLADDPHARFSAPPLTAAELHRVVESAAESVGLKFDDGIIEDLAKEVVGSAGALPTLQFTLRKLWDERERNRVTWETYRKVGRPREALRRAAEAVFDKLELSKRKTAERVFLALVQPFSDEPVKPETGDDFIRRRLRRETLLRVDEAERVQHVLDRYVETGLVRHSPEADPNDDRFEVAHEALIHNWPRLGEWLQKKRQESARELQLISTARLWRESGYEPGYLLSGDALMEAAAYSAAAPELKELVLASEKAALRRTRVNTVIATAAAAAVLTIAIVGYLLQENAHLYQQNRELLQNAEQVSFLQQKQIAALERRLQEVAAPIPRQSPGPEPIAPGAAQIVREPPTASAASSPSEQNGFIWGGSDGQSNLQDLTTSAAVPIAEVGVGGRYKLARNVVLRSGLPTPDYIQKPSLGVVPEGTPVTVSGSAQPYNRPSGKQYWVPVRVEPSEQPIVYLQFTTAPRANAQRISEALKSRGYRVPGLESTTLAKGLNEIRYYFPADRSGAEKLATDVRSALRSLKYELSSETKALDLTDQQGPRNHPGVIELWMDLPSDSKT